MREGPKIITICDGCKWLTLPACMSYQGDFVYLAHCLYVDKEIHKVRSTEDAINTPKWCPFKKK